MVAYVGDDIPGVARTDATVEVLEKSARSAEFLVSFD